MIKNSYRHKNLPHFCILHMMILVTATDFRQNAPIANDEKIKICHSKNEHRQGKRIHNLFFVKCFL